jgi:hypothetical protein
MSPSPRAQDGALTAIHLEFIQNQAEVNDGKALEQVEAYHRALFLNRHAGDLERLRQESLLRENRLGYLETRLRDTHGRLAEIEKLVPVEVEGIPDVLPTTPWNWWDRTMFILSLLGVAALLIFGVLNVSFNLLESGLVTFMENPVRAYFWAALLPVGALAVKVGWDFLQGQRRREVYLWCCLIAGLAGVLVWVVAYASVYPTLSKTAEEHLETLSVFDGGGQDGAAGLPGAGGVKRVDMLIVAAQAVAEIFLSAVLGMYMTMIYGRHRPVRLAGNPMFGQLDEERRALEEAVAQERSALGISKGEETRLEHQLAAFVAFARSMYERESALKRSQNRQQQALLDKIAEQLQGQSRPQEGPDVEGDGRRRVLTLNRAES